MPIEPTVSYKTISAVKGPLVVLEGVEKPAYNEIVQIELANGEHRLGQVLETSNDKAVVQVFQGTDNIDAKDTSVTFTGKPMVMGLSPDILGRTFNGSGVPMDGGPQIYPVKEVDINGAPINPASRVYPREMIETGISSIDVMISLARGQKLPLFSASGLPHDRIAAMIVRQAGLVDLEKSNESEEENTTEEKEKTDFCIVFAALGANMETARFFRSDFAASGKMDRTVLFMNTADDPAVERILTPRLALTAAEYLAYDLNMHVLVVMTDMTAYCAALRQISSAREEMPGRLGYPSYLYSDLASLYERAGRIDGATGSVTQIPILTCPQDDATHPVPDTSGYITEGQIFVGRAQHSQGYFPPIQVLGSLSRLQKCAIGKGLTRSDHAAVTSQLYVLCAMAQEARQLAAVVGEAGLGPAERAALEFERAFHDRFLNQSERRTIQESLDIAWDCLRIVPRSMLTRVSPDILDKWY